MLDLPTSGTKADLRARVSHTLEHGSAPKAEPKRRKNQFRWSKATLDRSTVITEDVSFGPNVRTFFKGEIGARFVCHSDFMEWMKSNPGKTLADAIEAWEVLEARKDDPTFRREIASCNNYLQYLRDARDAVPGMTLEEAKICWDFKKLRPAQDGFVVFEPQDVADAKAR